MATGFAEQYAAEFDEHEHPRDDGGKFTLKVSKVHGPKGEKFENLGGKQQSLFATEGLPGQMNLFADQGVPDDLLPKHLREPKRYEKDKDPGGQWVNLGGANAFVGPDGIITKGCEGLRGYHIDDLDDTQDERAAKQDQAEDAGWTSAKSDRARETWEAFKQSDPTHPHFIGLVRHGGKFHAFDDSARKLHDHLGIGDGQAAEFDEETLPHHMERLIEDGHRVAVIDRAEDGRPDLDSEADPAAQQAVEEAHEDLASTPPQQGFGIEEVHPERLKLTQDGREIGYMNLRVMGDRGFIDDTSIHAAARGQGVMQKLWPQIEQHFRDQGATSIRADVVDPAVGQKVWGPLGFVKEGMSGPVEVYRKQLGQAEEPAAPQESQRPSSRGTQDESQPAAPDVSPEDTSAADAWNAATKDPSSASDEQLQQAIDFATHLHGQHRQNEQLTPEQLTSLHDMIDGHVASLQQELERRRSGDQSGAIAGNDGGATADTERSSDSSEPSGSIGNPAGSQQSPDSGAGKGELDSPASLSLPDRHAAAGDRIKQAKGPLKSLLESLHRLRDTRKTGKVETKELGHEYAREMYDHLKSLRAQGGDEFGEVHDLSEELGHGALGYASPAGNIAMVPPKFKGEDWQARYTLPDPSQQAAEPVTPQESATAASDTAATGTPISQSPPVADPQQPDEPVAEEPSEDWVAPWEDSPTVKPKPKKGVNPKTKLGRAVIEAVGDDPEAQNHFAEIVKQIHSDSDAAARDRNGALRELLANFGFEGRDIGQFVRAARRYSDSDAFMRKSPLGRKFDQMVEMAQNYYPQLLYQGTGESIISDPEYALFERLQNGLERPPQPYDEQVISQALEYFASQERSAQEHRDRMENDPEYRQSFEDLKTAVFSRRGWKLRYAKWASKRLSRWYRYARQLSLFDDVGGSQPETKPVGKKKQKGLFDEDSHPRATEHVEIQGKAYEGGQWIPKDAAAEATPAEAEKIEVVDKDTGETQPMEEAVESQPATVQDEEQQPAAEPLEFKTAAQAAKEGLSFAAWQQPIADAYRHEKIDDDHPAWQSIVNAPSVHDYNDAMAMFGKHVRAHSNSREVAGKITDLSDDLKSVTITTPDGQQSRHLLSNVDALGPFLQDRIKRYIAGKGLGETRQSLSQSESAKYLATVMAQEALDKQINIGDVIKSHGFGVKEGMAIRGMVADEYLKLKDQAKPPVSEARKKAQDKRRQTDEQGVNTKMVVIDR